VTARMRTPMHLMKAVALAGSLALLSGCEDPYERRARESAAVHTATATSSPTPSPPPSRYSDSEVKGGFASQRTASGALRAFAERWSNWTWRDVAAQREALAELATAGLRQELLAGGEQPPDTRELRRTQPAMEGRIEVVSFKRTTGARRPAVVVIREQALERGEPEEGGLHYTVYLVEARRVRGGWAVATWVGQP